MKDTNFFSKLTFFSVILTFLTLCAIFFALNSSPRVVEVKVENNFSSAPKMALLTFSRNMDRRSVENNFSITPAFRGKFSWAGRRLAFTADEIFPYGQKFTLTVGGGAMDEQGMPLGRDYHFALESPSHQFFYIGAEGEEKDRIVASDLEGRERRILTASDLSVDSVKVSADGKKLYFLGYRQKLQNYPQNQLYEFDIQTSAIRQLTADAHFLLRDFFVSPDRQRIILVRIPLDSGETLEQTQFWMGTAPAYQWNPFDAFPISYPFFHFSPDGSYLLYKDDAGQFQLHQFDAQEGAPASLVGDFDQSFGFHPFLAMMALTRYDYTNIFSLTNFLTLFYGDGKREVVETGQGIVKQVLFKPDGKGLIAAFSRPEDSFDDRESFYPLRMYHLYSFDFSSKRFEPLTSGIDYSEENAVISPDSRFVLFERYDTLGGQLPIEPDYRDAAAGVADLQKGGAIWRLNFESGELVDLRIKGRNIIFKP